MFHVKPVFFLFAVSGIMHAGIIASGTETITGSESANGTSRLDRNGVDSTWASPKAFPGTLACGGGTCFFETLTFAPGSLQYVQVTETSISGTIFVAAYLDSFSNAALGTNYLGDPGSTTTIGGSVAFQVFVPTGRNLILVFNNIPGSPTDNQLGSVGYLVEGFTSPPTPEPASFGLAALGLAALAVVRKRIA